MARIIVKNFSCLTDVDMELSNLTVLIGGQATGKSLLAKLVWFFVNYLEEILNAGFYEIDGRGYKPSRSFGLASKEDMIYVGERLFDENFSLMNANEVAFEKLYFQLNKWKISISKERDKKINILLSEDIALTVIVFYQLKQDFGDLLSEHFDVMRGFINNNNIPRNSFFIPTGRFLFSSNLMSASIFRSESTDPTLLDFGMRFADLKDGYKHNSKSFLERDTDLTIKGKVKQNHGGFIIESNDGRTVPVHMSPSGQQELFPLLLSFDYINRGKVDFTVVEEPEAHLFPETQGVITKYITELAMKKYEDKPEHINHMFITTHSPYILSQLNSLLKAGRLAEQFKDDDAKLEEIAKIIPREYWLPRKNVNVYKMENGINHQLIDEEDGIIEGAYLDSLSNSILKEYNELLEIEYPDE